MRFIANTGRQTRGGVIRGLAALLAFATFLAQPAFAQTAPTLASEPIVGLAEGIAAFENGDYQSALTKLTPLADDDVAMAQNVLGRMYWQGRGVPQDSNKALLLFRKAAKQNLPNAKNNLGVMYASGDGVPQDFKQALFWLTEAANQGFAIAMNNLAEFYESGMGVSKDPIEAKKWRDKAQATGAAKSNELVTIRMAGSEEYEKGLELYYRFKFAEASALFLTAAEKGHPEAQLKLESMYQNGQGVEKSESQAGYWAKKAAAQGYSNSDGRDRIFLIDPSSEQGKRMKALADSTPVTRSSTEIPGGPSSSVTKDLARDAQVEAIGVYKGVAPVTEGSSRGTRDVEHVVVHIGRTAKPLVLVLSSHEFVRWALTLEPGANLTVVLISGFSQSEVVGAGNARVIAIGSAYPQERESEQFKLLDRDAMKWTGKSIGGFQGQYEGSSFRVGVR